MNIKWDATKYNSDFSFVPHYGSDLIDLIESKKGCSVLDLGCGNGTLTNALNTRGYEVIGLDNSEEFIKAAKRTYPDLLFKLGDATDFKLETPVDVVFSNAVFHWIEKEKQGEMLSCVHEALREGGEFIFEFGGYGCTRLIHNALAEIFKEHGYDYTIPFYFPKIGEYASLLENSGFEVHYATLFERPTVLKGEDGLKEWMKMFLKTPFSIIDNKESERIIEEASNILREELYHDGTWIADYVRIRMRALRI